MTVKDTNPKTAFGIRNWQRELMLRTSNTNRQSHGGFQWPESKPVEAPDWDLSPVCGGGLHGAARGEGNGTLLNWSADAVWQVVEYDPAEAIDLGGKIKIPRGVVIYSGNREEATRIIQKRYPGAAVIGGTAMAGDRGTATAGDYGIALAGHYGTATVRSYGHATTRDYGTATAGDYGHATVGDCGTATVGDEGIAAAGHCGTATVGRYGAAMAGDCGLATAGYRGAAAAGGCGIIQIAYFQGGRRRILTGYIGEDGLRPGVRYRVEGGEFVEAGNE